ncbi:MAG: hypothetical protein QM536_03255 [Chitinophagaceae bacterium]|nr:hypothetical protein [Chitinophagaceae bacterium]
MDITKQKPEKFYNLRSNKVINAFRIQVSDSCERLTTWLNYFENISNEDNLLLQSAIEKYNTLHWGWNEEELKMHFISLIMHVANLNIKGICKFFYERSISGIVENKELSVICDGMMASYTFSGEPDVPYFFMQELKKANEYGKNDAQGQMLAAMLIAREQNKNNKYIYGCYVIERNWFFATLKKDIFCVSGGYDATEKEDLMKIVCTLRHLKKLIVEKE